MRTIAWLAGAVVLAVAVSLATGARAAGGNWLDPGALEVKRIDGGLSVRFAAHNSGSRTLSGSLSARVTDLDGNVLLSNERKVTIEPGNAAVMLSLPGSVPEERIPLCVLRYELSTSQGSERGSKSLTEALASLETHVVAYTNWLAGSPAAVRVVALNHSTGEPIPSAKVVFSLAPNGKSEKEIYSGVTDGRGTLEAQFRVPNDVEGPTQLIATVAADGLGADRVTQPVTIARKTKILLTTDKPVYQPGQLIHMRALSLGASDMAPAGKQALVFEVMDGKGNKVFKKKLDTDTYGVASSEFQLASEVNLGGYIVRAILGTEQSEKQVTVDRYVLPKFKVEVKTDKEYYLPGQTLKGEIQSDYFFGKPAAGAKVVVIGSKFEIQFEEFGRAEGKLDENGHWTFELPLPAYFAGTPIEQGKASVRLEAKVTDTADHLEEKVVMKPVAAAPIAVYAVPEGGALAPGLENKVYLLASYPDGSPAAGASLAVTGVSVRVGAAKVEADELGIATVGVTPEASGNPSLNVSVRDKQGQSAEKQIPLTQKGPGVGLILRADKALYRVGDTIKAQVITTKPKGTVYFDLVRQGQTIMTRSADIADGKASLAMDVDASMSGSVALQAYVFTPGTDLVRDARLLYINPADALTLAVTMDQETYRPGDKAQLRFAVSNQAGGPAAAALGVSIVDESVFAMQEIHPGLEKVYFTLEKEIMKPRYEIHGYEMEKLVMQPLVQEKGAAAAPQAWTPGQQEAAQVLLASAPPAPKPPVCIDTFAQKAASAQRAYQERCQKDLARIENAVSSYIKKGTDIPENLVDELLRKKYLRENDLTDPWGNRYDITVKTQGAPRPWISEFRMISYGPDGVKGTADDIVVQQQDRARILRNVQRAEIGGVVMEKMALQAPPAAAQPKAAPMILEDKKSMADTTALAGTSAPGAEQPVRLRQYFPETLLFKPDLITDGQGVATLDVPLADSITTWRMTAMASSAQGALGSKDTPLRVFQDFFVDIDLPVTLTQHDRVSIPVVLYNYLKEAQPVKLTFDQEPWFKLDGPAEKTIDLGPNEVKAMYFPIEVTELGKHRLTVHGQGAKLSDAIRREIEVLPDGEEQNVSFSDRLSGTVEQTVTIPENAVPGASKILVRVFPGVYSQIVDGLDSMLQMPSGCFEQTSSIVYPDILVVQYMKATKQINPEIQMKAEGYINAGYQRLLSYEVPGGGYSWFGTPPANKVLTAWGLKEFYDMSLVHEVDPKVIERTRKWLVSKQEADGSWKPDEAYLHQESWGGIQKSSTLVTAYILDAVLNSGPGAAGPETQKALDYLRAHWEVLRRARAPLPWWRTRWFRGTPKTRGPIRRSRSCTTCG
ncbi:MAG: hypothetical protein HZB26_05885 [Candidatus Hydrogenedentes bacterium]|nr:hypothetical protein [Candidatus Hydrogenedentota bacterium]